MPDRKIGRHRNSNFLPLIIDPIMRDSHPHTSNLPTVNPFLVERLNILMLVAQLLGDRMLLPMRYGIFSIVKSCFLHSCTSPVLSSPHILEASYNWSWTSSLSPRSPFTPDPSTSWKLPERCSSNPQAPNLNLQRFNVLHISGNYSAILSKLDRRFEALQIRLPVHSHPGNKARHCSNHYTLKL